MSSFILRFCMIYRRSSWKREEASLLTKVCCRSGKKEEEDGDGLAYE